MFSFLMLIDDPVKRDRLAELVYKHNNALVKYARSWLWRRGRSNYVDEGEDVVQNAYLKMVKYIDTVDFSQDDEKLRRYMYIIVKNEAVNYIMESPEHDSFDETEYLDSEEKLIFDDIEQKDTLKKVINAINDLNDRYAYPIAMYYSYGSSVREIAKDMGIPEATVYTRLERGMKKVREKLEQEGEI